MKRKLGRSGVDVSAIGMGCWAIGGTHARQGHPVGWGEVNDAESIRALQKAFELGVVAKGQHITCYFDGEALIEADDATYASGKVGLWTKADSVTAFDDLQAKNLNAIKP